MSDSGPVLRRRRGTEFEQFLFNVLDKESLSPRLRFRPKGEEVDGSFLFDLRVFLMEAKWHKDPLPASSIYTFRGKVEGKLAGTLGVFISMSGFSESAVDALTAGKVANVLLFDGDDVRACLTHGFTAVLRTKLRAAAEAGVVFYRFMSAQPARSNEGASSRPVTTDISRSDRGPRLFVVCEGPADVTVLSALAQRVVETSLATSTIRIVAAGGKLGLARVANAVSGLLDPAGKILIVADSDGEPEKIAREIEDGLRADSAEVIIVEPQLEIWLAAGASDPRGQIREEARRRGQAMTSLLQGAANEISLEALAKSSQSFRKFRDFLLAEVGERAEE
jgi:hypothetical protein